MAESRQNCFPGRVVTDKDSCILAANQFGMQFDGINGPTRNSPAGCYVVHTTNKVYFNRNTDPRYFIYSNTDSSGICTKEGTAVVFYLFVHTFVFL